MNTLSSLLNFIGNYISTLDNRMKPVQIINTTYTSSTTWENRATFTTSVAGLYRIVAGYSNSPVLGMAVGSSSDTQLYATRIMAEDTTGASIDKVMYLGVGSYSVWTKCGTNGGTNAVAVYKLIEVA